MSQKKTKDEEAIIALAHALADQRWIAEDRLDDVNSLQEDNDNLRAQIGELREKQAHMALIIKEQQVEIARLNEDCARRAKDLVTFDEMRKEAIAQRDVTQGLLEKRSECLADIATTLGLASTDWSRIILRINALQVAAKCVTTPGDTLAQFPNPPHPQHVG